MSKYGTGISFLNACRFDRDILKAALHRRLREYDEEEEEWVESPCTKEESVEIALEVFDELVYHAKEFLYASRALEQIMNHHGLKLGQTYSLEEYSDARMQIEKEIEADDSDDRVITIVK